MVKTLREERQKQKPECQLSEGGPRRKPRRTPRRDSDMVRRDPIQCHVTEAREIEVQESGGIQSETKAMKYSVSFKKNPLNLGSRDFRCLYQSSLTAGWQQKRNCNRLRSEFGESGNKVFLCREFWMGGKGIGWQVEEMQDQYQVIVRMEEFK